MLKICEKTIVIDGENLTIEQVVKVARHNWKAELADTARDKMVQSRQMVEDLLQQDQAVYGVTTGFGKFSDVIISTRESDILQENLIRSHAGGVGDPLPIEVVRAMMLLRANSLAKGHSGARPLVVTRLLDLLNRNITPRVPSQGSVGASGDLVPLAHMALVLIGRGEAYNGDDLMPGREALEQAGIEPLKLSAKEGLALINGTQYMSALGSLALYDAWNLMAAANITAALTVEALQGLVSAFDAQIHALRPHKGQHRCASHLRRLLRGSDLEEHLPPSRVQDAYSLRCIPQVHGATMDALNYVQGILETEINSATDNPLLFPETGQVISGGNFHGQPLALALDFLAMAVSELAGISERRLERLLNPALSGLPPFLTAHGGLNSGLMISQYTAAALVSENKVLAHPASVDSIPTSANQEDHVSMGSIAARKARQVVENVAWVLSAELLAACQGLEFRSHQFAGAVTRVHELVRTQVPPWDQDRELYLDLEKVHRLIAEGSVAEVAEAQAGGLLA